MNTTKVDFGSLLTYTPTTTSTESKIAKETMKCLKFGRSCSGVLTLDDMAQKIKKLIDTLPFSNYFNKNTILIPIPNSSLTQPNTLWIPQCITAALIANGLGKSPEPCLERFKPVPRSTGQRKAEDRPKPIIHYESMRVKKLLHPPEEIVLVDDVITRGATIMGGVNRLQEAYPDATIRGFAMIRTMSNPDEFKNVEDPCIGTITMDGEDTRRIP